MGLSAKMNLAAKESVLPKGFGMTNHLCNYQI